MTPALTASVRHVPRHRLDVPVDVDIAKLCARNPGIFPEVESLDLVHISEHWKSDLLDRMKRRLTEA